MFFYLTAQHTMRIVRLVMRTHSTHTNGRGDSAAQSLIAKAASTNWLVRFVNGGQMIEWGISKAAIVSLMQSRYGFTQWVEFVQGIDPLTPVNNPNNA